MQALRIGASGMLAQQRATEVIANNLANMNTTAFQRRRSEFHDLIYVDQARPDNKHSRAGDVVPGGVQSGYGVTQAATYRISEQGSLRATDNTFDLAVQGRGYFQVAMPDGNVAYTRDGTFQPDANGNLVTPDGLLLDPAITVPANAVDVTINGAGEVLAKLDGDSQPVNLGQITLATFPNAAGLRALGNNLLAETPASGAPAVQAPGQPGTGSLLQGFVEASNVNPVEEISALIKAHRAYDMNSKVVQTADQMLAPVQG